MFFTVTIELNVASAQAVHTTSREISHENLSLNYEKIQLIIIVPS